VIGAHYDVAGDTPGADDNASGVAGLLELGRLLHQYAVPLKYPIMLVVFPLEEPPFFNTRFMGSAVHAQSLAKQGQTVRLMICLEMIGYFSDAPGSQRLPLPLMRLAYPTVGNFIALVSHLGSLRWLGTFRQSFEAGCSIPVEQLSAPKLVPGVALSDHINYWRQGYQALMLTDTAMYRNPHYHMPTDTITTLDFKRMAEVIRGVYWTLLHPDQAFP
jgi:Zn-dependent M28 family amino/carboxypeptidase